MNMFIIVCTVLFSTYIAETTGEGMCLNPDLNILRGNGMKVISSPIIEYQSAGLMDCFRQCGLHSICHSINYNKTSLHCEINYQDNGSVIFSSDSVFGTSLNKFRHLLGACAEHECPNDSVCKVNISQYGYTCIRIGCIATPNVDHINITSFTSKPLWTYNTTVTYACLAGYYPSTNVHCENENGWVTFRCISFKKCPNLLMCQRSLEVATYWIYAKQFSTWIKLYCDTEFTYINLHYENVAKIPSFIRESNSCAKIPVNISQYQDMGVTQFHKVRISLYQSKTNNYNTRYATTIGAQQVFGKAGDCYGDNNSTECGSLGYFKIDLRETGLKLKNSTTWITWGVGGKIDNISRSYNGLVIEGYCGGVNGCGGCKPDSTYLELDLNNTPSLDSSAILYRCKQLV